MTKSTYSAPVLRAHGSIEVMTKANLGGSTTDAIFPASTPLGDITTS